MKRISGSAFKSWHYCLSSPTTDSRRKVISYMYRWFACSSTRCYYQEIVVRLKRVSPQWHNNDIKKSINQLNWHWMVTRTNNTGRGHYQWQFNYMYVIQYHGFWYNFRKLFIFVKQYMHLAACGNYFHLNFSPYFKYYLLLLNKHYVNKLPYNFFEHYL